MKSRLLNRLDAAIRDATSHLNADCLRCERAAYLARLGDFDKATQELSAIHQRYDARPTPATSAWLSLADGLVSHYSDHGPVAHDKLKRAHALSKATGLAPIQALSAAWLAHLHYLRQDAPAMARHAAEALALAAEDHHAARARAALVVAQGYHDGGRFDLARPWYDQARRHVDADGDEAMLSAMLWNMASVRVAALRQAEAGATPAGAAGAHALLSAESTANFDGLIGVRSLQSLQPILRAQICTVLGQTDEALWLYEAHLAAAVGQGLAPIEGVLLADRAWCRLRAGRQQDAREDAAAAEACLAVPGPCCDRAPGHSRLAQVYESLGERGAAVRQQQLAARAWQGHARDQQSLVDALNLALLPPAP